MSLVFKTLELILIENLVCFPVSLLGLSFSLQSILSQEPEWFLKNTNQIMPLSLKKKTLYPHLQSSLHVDSLPLPHFIPLPTLICSSPLEPDFFLSLFQPEGLSLLWKTLPKVFTLLPFYPI